jgi:hypothetical protein
LDGRVAPIPRGPIAEFCAHLPPDFHTLPDDDRERLSRRAAESLLRLPRVRAWTKWDGRAGVLREITLQEAKAWFDECIAGPGWGPGEDRRGPSTDAPRRAERSLPKLIVDDLARPVREPRKTGRPRTHAARDAKILRSADAGTPHATIAERHGISAENVRQIIYRMRNGRGPKDVS